VRNERIPHHLAVSVRGRRAAQCWLSSRTRCFCGSANASSFSPVIHTRRHRCPAAQARCQLRRLLDREEFSGRLSRTAAAIRPAISPNTRRTCVLYRPPTLVSRDWEVTFNSWSRGPSDTESAKAENSERMIRKAISASSALAQRQVEVFTQGSYRNNTNVRQDSDVDVCVRLMDLIEADMPAGLSDNQVGLSDATGYAHADFKDDVGAALRSYFGAGGVTRGDKAFDVHENTYRIDADVVATVEHRRYVLPPDGRWYYLSGTLLRADSGGKIINWPNQHYDNGVAKNTRTARRYKRLVRIIKRLRNEMVDQHIAAAEPIPSYLIECLVWNVPDEGLNHSTYTADVRWALAHLFNNTMTDEACKEWGEVNELKYLFGPWQAWTREQAHAFVSAAWDYIGFG
jgi:hypothetical protein